MKLQILQITAIIAVMFHGTVRAQIQTRIACETTGSRNVHCPVIGQYINVLEAYYGRTNSFTCGGFSSNSNCFAGNSPAIIRNNCQGKTACILNPSNSVFGDPCHGVVKYVELRYECTSQPTKNVFACESQRPVQVTCPAGYVIHVNSAYYGRKNIGTCGHSLTTNCESSLSNIINQQCHLKPSCYLHGSNSVFNDPCPNVPKFAEMNYHCVPQHGHSLYSATVCESDKLEIGCLNGKKLQIWNAFYGRNDASSCPGPIHNTNCRSTSSTNYLFAICNQQTSCWLRAYNKIFGDPCFGTRKFIKIRYYCL